MNAALFGTVITLFSKVSLLLLSDGAESSNIWFNARLREVQISQAQINMTLKIIGHGNSTDEKK